MNLIITCARRLEPETEEEIRDILEELGDSDPEINITKISGILTVKTSLEPIQVTERMRDMLLDEPWSIRYCLRVIPIQDTIESKMEEFERIAALVSEKISKGETYKISIEKRNSELSSKDIISKVADKIKNKVSLDFPDKIVLIEILGDKAGISVIRDSDILSTEKTKRSMSE